MTADSATVKGDMATGNGMSALVVEGGALRGVFSTGLLDGFLEADFNPFDLYIGVSAGASNLAAYLAGMKGRNGRIYRDYSLRPEFIDFGRFLRGGHLLDLDWLWEITIREIRLDLATIYARQKPFVVVLTDVLTGQAVYRQTAAEDLEHTLKASSAIPLLYRRYPEVDGRPSTDGGIADAIPVGEAIRRGARRVMVIRSRPRDYVKRRGLSDRLLVRHTRDCPLLGDAMNLRAARYNESVALIRKPPAGVDIIEICPPADFRVSRLSRNRRILDEGYEQGRRLATEAIRHWEG
ncbi:MAG: patatin family protein [Syntrophaceae bacterium]|nr:patatin family protein [Syntrophaceae bacterium]